MAAESEMETGTPKRLLEDAPEPDAKRANLKGNASTPEMITSVCTALSGTPIETPSWSGSLREYLLASVPPVLQTPHGQRSSSEEIMLRLLDEIFAVEEDRLDQCLKDKGQAKVDDSVEKRKTAEADEEETRNHIKEQVEELKEKIGSLPKEIALAREAETKWRQSMCELLTKQKEALEASISECFEPLKAGSWADESEHQRLLLALMPVLRQNITDGTLLSSSEGALSKKPEDRGTFGEAVMQQLEADFGKHLTKLQEKCQLATAAVKAQEEVKAIAEVTFEEVEAMCKQGEKIELAEQKELAIEARKKSFELLKEGRIEEKRQQTMHIAKLKKVCGKTNVYKQIGKNAESKALIASFPAALQKKPEARADSDSKVVDDLEAVLDKHIASLDEQIDEPTLELAAERKKLDFGFSIIKQAVENDAEEREGKQQALTKERDALLELKNEVFLILKAGSWATPEALKGLLKGKVSLPKLFKEVDMNDKTMVKTITGILQKKPDARAEFDNVMVQQMEDSIEKRLATFIQKLNDVQTVGKYVTLKEAVEAVDAAQAALQDARETQQVKLQEAVYADIERLRLESVLEQRQNAVKEKVENEKEVAASHAGELKGLEQFRDARSSLKALREGNIAPEGNVAPEAEKDSNSP